MRRYVCESTRMLFALFLTVDEMKEVLLYKCFLFFSFFEFQILFRLCTDFETRKCENIVTRKLGDL